MWPIATGRNRRPRALDRRRRNEKELGGFRSLPKGAPGPLLDRGVSASLTEFLDRRLDQGGLARRIVPVRPLLTQQQPLELGGPILRPRSLGQSLDEEFIPAPEHPLDERE